MIYRKPKYEFQSVFAPFIYDYLEIKDATGQKYTSPGNILRQFDRYCSLNGVEEPNLTEVIVNDWLSTKTGEKNSTHSTRISVLRCFSKYLSASGNIISWNPYPGYTSRVSKYVPYIFCKDEMLQIFASADLMPVSCGRSRFHFAFPIILRVLYGCGLRVSEALKLTIRDVDLENGFISVRSAKFDKQRRIPISKSLLIALRNYMVKNQELIGVDAYGFFFPNANGECYSQRTVYDKFRTILWQSGIPHQGKGKGPRVHDLRHTFAVHSLQQNIKQGKDMYVSLTILMTYLGHSKLSSTEYYLRLTAEVFPDFLQKSDTVCAVAIPEVINHEK